MKHGFIYTLVCPDTDNIIYVGSSIAPEKRFRQHTLCCENEKLRQYMKVLANEGKVLILNIVEKCERGVLLNRENFYINEYKNSNPLANVFIRKAYSKSADNTDELRKKMLIIKQRLPNHYINILIAKFPQYVHLKGRVRKVVALQLADEKIINDLQKITL